VSRYAIGRTLIILCFLVSAFLIAASLRLLRVPDYVLQLGIVLVQVFYAAGVATLPRREERAARIANYLLGLVASLVICGVIIGMTIGTPVSPKRVFLVVLGIITGIVAVFSAVCLLSALGSSDDGREN
jgi:hypothetical protein